MQSGGFSLAAVTEKVARMDPNKHRRAEQWADPEPRCAGSERHTVWRLSGSLQDASTAATRNPTGDLLQPGTRITPPVPGAAENR